MSPGQRRYIELRLASVLDRMAWMRHHMDKTDTPEWMQIEFPKLQAKADALRARLQ